jgi:hypothetical protein
MSAVASVVSVASVASPMALSPVSRPLSLRQPVLRVVASDDVEFSALGAVAARIIQSLATKVVPSTAD